MSELVQTNLGRFPEEWPFKPVGEVFDTQLGKMLSQKARGGDDPKPYLRNKNVQWGYIEVSDVLTMDFNEREKVKFKLQPGDLLVCEGGVVGRAALWNGAITECYYQKALHRLRPTNGSITNEFMFYWLRFAFEIQNFYGVSGASSTIAHLPAAQLRALEIPLPPLPEQKKIAHILSTVQRAIEAQERIIQTTTELKKALMHKLFTEGLRNEPQKRTEIGPVPESWEVVELSEIARIERGKFSHRPRNEPRFYGGEYPFVQTGDVSNCDGYVRSFTQTLNEDGLAISKMFPAGTILITIAANIGFTGILQFDSACPDSLIGITPSERAHTQFLNYFLITQQPEMDRLAPKGTQKNINIQFLKPWPIPLPTVEEQEEIAVAFSATDEKIRLATAKRNELQDLFRTLLHELMTAKTRVHKLEITA